MNANDESESHWIRRYGRDIGERLDALEAATGETAVRRFLNGKLHGRPYGGLYLSGVLFYEDGEDVICGLLDGLLRGELIRLVSLRAYYANDRRIPAGMKLVDGKLVDVLDDPKDPEKIGNGDAV